MPALERYQVALCQLDQPNPTDRAGMRKSSLRMTALMERAVLGYEPFFDVRLVVFPEFGHAAPVYETVAELEERLALPAENEEIDLIAAKAKELGCWVQTASFIESDPRFPGRLFNTTLLIDPEGRTRSRYRKVNPWIPWEVHSSPHDIPDYPDDPLPVVETELGNLAVATCYDWLFPELLRSYALRGAEVLIRISAYMDPWGATEPMDWWTVVNRCRALENQCFVAACNQGASEGRYPPFSWPGGSMVVDYDGRVLSQASPGPGEKIVVAPIDLAALRHARERRLGHDLRAHHRAELYGGLSRPVYPAGKDETAPSVADLRDRIRAARRRLHED